MIEGATELRNNVAGEKEKRKNVAASQTILERSLILEFGFEFTVFSSCDVLFEKKAPSPGQ